MLQLKMNHTSDCPSFTTDELSFPFLICEVKCGEKAMSEAKGLAM